MNKIILILSFILVFELVYLTHAYGDKYMPINDDWAEKSGEEIYQYLPYFQVELKPDVCILENTNMPEQYIDNQYKEAVTEGVKIWERGLYGISDNWYETPNGVSWTLDVKVIEEDDAELNPLDYIECDIFVVFSGLNEKDEAIGVTHYDFTRSSHKFSIITIYTQVIPPDAVIELTPDSSKWNKPINLGYNAVRQIMTHEMGHALGLGHYYPGIDNPSFSVMKTKMNPFNDEEYVPPQYLDFYALIDKYGADGFKLGDMGTKKGFLIYPSDNILLDYQLFKTDPFELFIP